MLRKLHQGVRIGLLGLTMVCSAPLWAASESDEYVAEAREYLSQGKANEAIIQLKNALKSDPSNVDARVLLGNIYLRSGDAGGAAKEFNRAARLGAPKQAWVVGLGQALLMQSEFSAVLDQVNPDDSMVAEQHATALAIRGNAYIGLNNVVKAVEAYDAALAVQSSNPLARLGKARLLVKDKQLDEAATQFTAVLEEYPEHVETRLARGELYRSLSKYPAAIEDFSVAIEKAPHNVRGYIGRALSYVASQQAEQAKPDIEQLSKRARDLPITHYLKALVAFLEQKFDTASDELQLVLRNAPDNLQAQVLYGIVSYARGEYTIADDYLSRAIQRQGPSAQLNKLLGASRLKLKQADRAVDALEPLIESNPEDVQLIALLGTAYMQAGDAAKGAEFLAKAVELSPDQAMLRTQLAAGQIAMGNAAAAITELESAVNLGQDLIQADVLLVLSYLNERNYDQAIEAAGALEQRMPESPIPPNLTGLAYLAQSKFDDAKAKFQQALSIDANFVVAHMNMARMALLQQDADMAREQYERVLNIDNGHVGALMGLAGLDMKAGQEGKAEGWLLRATRENPGVLQPVLVLAELYLKRSESLKANNLLTGLSPEQASQPAALRIKGMAQLQSGEFSSAKVTFEKLVEATPTNIEGWFQLARAQAAAGDVSGSRASFNRAIELDTEHKLPLVWIGKGELELREEQYDDALAVAGEMQKHFPDNAMGYEIEAAAHRGKGNIPAAIKAVEKAVRAEGSSKRINLFAHTLAASGNTPKAVYMLQDWLEKNPEDGVSWTTLGMMQQQMGQIPEALKAYEQALEFTGGNPVVLNNMAWLYLDSDPERAVKLGKQAYEIAPERAEIVDTYGWVLFKLGKQREALNVLQQALVIAPRNAEIGLHVAEALHSLGRDSEAKPLLDRVLEEHPHTQWAGPARDLLKKLRN